MLWCVPAGCRSYCINKVKYEFKLLKLAWQLFLRIIITNSYINKCSYSLLLEFELRMAEKWDFTKEDARICAKPLKI